MRRVRRMRCVWGRGWLGCEGGEQRTGSGERGAGTGEVATLVGCTAKESPPLLEAVHITPQMRAG